ncbi:MAG: tetratricopeptide repeat protein [bacterium]|nr:tetratricopeptide repeat protein [bacterium]
MRIAGLISDFIQNELLAGANPNERMGIEYTVREALDAASRNIEGRFPGEPLVEAAIRSTIGLAYFELGEYDTATAHWRIVVQLREKELGPHDRETIDALNSLGISLLYARDDDGERQTLEALHRAEANFPPNDRLLLVIRINLGAALKRQARLQEAESVLRSTLPILEQTFGVDDEDTLSCRSVLGSVLMDQRELTEAEEHLRFVYDVRTGLEPTHAKTIEAANKLAVLYEVQRRFDDAVRLHQDVLARRLEVLDEEHEDVLTTSNNLGSALRVAKRLEEARTVFEKLLPVLVRELGSYDRNVAMTRGNLALTLSDLGATDEARAVFEQLMHDLDQTVDLSPAIVVTSLTNFGRFLREEGEFDRSEPILSRAIEVAETELDQGHPKLMLAIAALARQFRTQERYDEAMTLFARGAALAREYDTALPFDFDYFLYHLGLTEYKRGRFEEAERFALETYRSIESRDGAQDQRAKHRAKALAKIYQRLERPEEARRWAELSQ